MEWRRGIIPDVRHPGGMSENSVRVECRRGRIPDVICPDGMAAGRIPGVGERLERETGLVGRMDMEAWVSGFNGYAKE